MSAPIIVSALFSAEDHAWLDAQRRANFPPERNQLSAHLTLFHHLPPSVLEELRTRLKHAAAGKPPRAWITDIMSLGGGTAYRVESAELEALRADLAGAFQGLLTPQDRAGFRPHVTIQNKVSGKVAKALQDQLRPSFATRPLAIAALAAWWYRGGPWEEIAHYPFRGGKAR